MLEIQPGTVFIVDDDVYVREALEDLLSVSGWKVCSFPSAESFLADHDADGPCCLILDVRLPGLNGLDVQAALAEHSEAVPIIFITGNGDVPTTVRAMKAGAFEFLIKPFSESDLVGAVKGALDRCLFQMRERSELASIRGRFETLTRREHDVMALVVTGLMNKQIAYELGISEITVKVHRGRVMAKTKARSLAELVTLAGRMAPAASAENVADYRVARVGIFPQSDQKRSQDGRAGAISVSS